MVSSIFRHRMRPVVEQTGKAHVVSTWRVDPHSLIFLLKGTLTYDRILPYNKELLEPQRDLLTYIMKQLYSKDLVINTYIKVLIQRPLGLLKQRGSGYLKSGRAKNRTYPETILIQKSGLV